jgi:hypothetical protein
VTSKPSSSPGKPGLHVMSYRTFYLISQDVSVKMLRVDRKTDVLPELNEDGRSPRKLTAGAQFSGKTSVMSLHVDALPS